MPFTASSRRKVVLGLVFCGHPVKQIAAELGYSIKTISKDLTKLRRAARVSTTGQLIRSTFS